MFYGFGVPDWIADIGRCTERICIEITDLRHKKAGIALGLILGFSAGTFCTWWYLS